MRNTASPPKAKQVDGVKCVPSVADLPERVDMAVVAIPASAAARAVMDLVVKRKAESIILIPGGFAETKRGRSIEAEVKAVMPQAHAHHEEEAHAAERRLPVEES